MCSPASFLVLQNRVVFSKEHNSHQRMIKENGLTDMCFDPQFVRVEIVPLNYNYDYTLPFEQWYFHVNQDYSFLPDWFDRREAENACRKLLPEWAKHHMNTPTCEEGQSRVFTEGERYVNGGEAWFCGTATGMVMGGIAHFDGKSTGSVHGGKAYVYSRDCEVVHATYEGQIVTKY